MASFPENVKDNMLAKAWVDTFKSLGYGVTGDPFSGKVTGGFVSAISVDPESKERSYAASAYYAPAQNRLNLHVITDALVEKIILEHPDDSAVDNDDGIIYRAGFVQYAHEGQVKTAKVNKEVILCAGAFQSPQILELSGIGDRRLLESHGIKVLIDNPNVGENLQDHPFTAISYEVKDGITTADILRQDPKAAEAAVAEYMSNKTGPMTSAALTSFAFMPIVDFLTPDDAGPAALKDLLDKHLHDTPTDHHNFICSILQDPTETSGSFFMAPIYANLDTDPINPSPTGQVIPEGNYITLGASLLHPFSCGWTHISSPSAHSPPLINPAYFSHALDAELFAYHVLFLETIASTAPLASFLKPSGRRTPAVPTRLTSLDAAKEFLRQSTISNWHPTSSCSMLPREKGGVVDPRLRVYGTKNLRVVDASVMPIVPRGNPQSSVYAIAERAVDLIREDL